MNRILAPTQSCSISVFDCETGVSREVFRTGELLLEAPNWVSPAMLVVNGDGVLWQIDLETGTLQQMALPALPFLNNDHVPSPDGRWMFVSGFDWHIHRVDLLTGATRQITYADPARPMRHFLHGVSPDGGELALIGIEPRQEDPWGSANVFTLPVSGGRLSQITFGNRPADGSEYSADGEWIYFNTEIFSDKSGHAQIARVARAGGVAEQLTFDERVNWFPHLAPGGNLACYLSYPPETTGHPADLKVELRLVRGGDWAAATTVARLNGGQGTINVNSWSPDGRRFAYVSYPFE